MERRTDSVTERRVEAPPAVPVLGIPLFAGRLEAACRQVIQLCLRPDRGEPLCVSATGAHGLIEARTNPEFARVLRGFYLNLPDGKPAVWIGRWKGARGMERCYGPDFFAGVLRSSAPLPIRHFFCGGKAGVADRLREVVKSRFGNRNVVGTFCPPFRPMTEEECVRLAGTMDDLETDIAWIGISTPKQEFLAARLARRSRRVRIFACVGAAFDFHIGAVPQAPRWMQEAGLEWLFRLLSEPRRLWRRYAYVVPMFIWWNAWERLRQPEQWSAGRVRNEEPDP